MSIKLRRAVILFILLLAALAFFSKSIVYWTTPKVVTATVGGGTIVYQNNVTAWTIESDALVKVTAAFSLPEGLPVTFILSGSQKHVEKGDVLLKVEETALRKKLLEAQNAYYAAYISQKSYEKEFAFAAEEAVTALQKAEEALKKEPRASEKRKKCFKPPMMKLMRRMSRS